jgi:hypothetical protein
VLVRCIRSLCAAVLHTLIPSWQFYVGKIASAKNYIDLVALRSISNILNWTEETLLQCLALVEVCLQSFRSVLLTDYDVAFCNYSAAFHQLSRQQHTPTSSLPHPATGAPTTAATATTATAATTATTATTAASNGGTHSAARRPVSVITPLSYPFHSKASLDSGASLSLKRPFPGSSSPLAKKLFKPSGQSQGSSPVAMSRTGPEEEADDVADWDLRAKEPPAVSLELSDASAEMDTVVRGIGSRLLLVDPSSLCFPAQPDTWNDGTADRGRASIGSGRTNWHAHSIIRLTHRLSIVTRHINHRCGDVPFPQSTEMDTDERDFDFTPPDASLDVTNMIRRVLLFVQRQRKCLNLKPRLQALFPVWAESKWGLEVLYFRNVIIYYLFIYLFSNVSIGRIDLIVLISFID